MELKGSFRSIVVSDEELEIIKEALDSFHEKLKEILKEEVNTKLEIKTIKIEEMCQELGIPGYDFS